MAVNTGAELQNKGRELIRHFETQGTPVMIGMCYLSFVHFVISNIFQGFGAGDVVRSLTFHL